MAWIAGALIVNPAAQQTLVETVFTAPGPKYVSILVSAQIPMETFFRLVNKDGVTVKSQIPIPVTAGITQINRIGPISVDINERFQVVNRNASGEVSNEEVQANMFIEP